MSKNSISIKMIIHIVVLTSLCVSTIYAQDRRISAGMSQNAVESVLNNYGATPIRRGISPPPQYRYTWHRLVDGTDISCLYKYEHFDETTGPSGELLLEHIFVGPRGQSIEDKFEWAYLDTGHTMKSLNPGDYKLRTLQQYWFILIVFITGGVLGFLFNKQFQKRNKPAPPE